MTKKFMAALLSLAAFAAMAVVPSMASASPHLTETPNVTVPVGAKITGTNETNITLTTGSGHVTCTKSVLTGTVTENSGTSIKGNIETASFTNNTGGACSSTFPFNPSFTVDVENLPYCLTSEAGDTFTVRGGACGAAAKNLKFTLTGPATCTYEAASISGTFNTNADLTMAFSEQTFTKTAGGFLCPNSGRLDGAYNVFTDNAEEKPLIIT